MIPMSTRQDTVIDIPNSSNNDVGAAIADTLEENTEDNNMADDIPIPGMVLDNNEKGDSGNSERSYSSLESSQERGPNHLAYEVPAEGNAESLIKRHPPLRFRKLEENQVEISQEMINFKQAEAEKRRTEIIQDRIKSARATSARARSSRMRQSKPNLQSSGDSGIETHIEHSPDPHLDNDIL